MTPRNLRVVVVAVAVLGLLAAGLVACGGDGDRVSTADVPDAQVVDYRRDPGQGVAEVDPDRTDVLSAGDLRLALEQVLAEHAWLTVDAMRAAADHAPELPAVLDVLTANTTSLTRAIGLVYGPAGARAFDQLWTQHIQFFLDYAVAAGRGDDDGRREAVTSLEDYQLDFSSFADTATGGLAPLHAVHELLHTHVTQVLAAIDAYVGGDAVAAAATNHDAYLHMFPVAQALAGAIVGQQPAAFPGTIDSGPVDARSAAGQALGEHTLLAADVVRATADGVEPDDAVLAELEAARGRSVTALGGDDAVADAWAALDVALLAHAGQLAAGGDVTELDVHAAASQLADVLDGDPVEVRDALAAQAAALAGVAEATARGDAPAAYAAQGQAFAGSFTLAAVVLED